MILEHEIYSLNDKFAHLMNEISRLKRRVRVLETYSNIPQRYKDIAEEWESQEEIDGE